MTKLLLLLALVGAMAGCARTSFVRSISPTATASGETNASQTSQVSVRLLNPGFSNRTADLPAFEVEFINRGPAPVPFSLASVTVRSGSADVRVYTPAEFAARIRREANFDRYNARTRGEMRAQAAEYDPHAIGSVPTILIRTDAMHEEAAVNWAERRQLAQTEQMLYARTVPPGGRISGVIKLHAEDIRPGEPLLLTINVGGESHAFNFDVGR